MAGLLYQYLPGMSYIADDPAPAETLRDEVLGPLAGSWTLPSEWRPFRPEKFNDCKIIQSMFSTDPNRRKYYTEIVKLLLHESPISFKSLTYNSSLLKCLSIPCTFKKFDQANILLIFPTSLYLAKKSCSTWRSLGNSFSLEHIAKSERCLRRSVRGGRGLVATFRNSQLLNGIRQILKHEIAS